MVGIHKRKPEIIIHYPDGMRPALAMTLALIGFDPGLDRSGAYTINKKYYPLQKLYVITIKQEVKNGKRRKKNN